MQVKRTLASMLLLLAIPVMGIAQDGDPGSDAGGF
jgi:hypothetical protein